MFSEPINTQSSQKRPNNFGNILLTEAFFGKTFEGELFIRSHTMILIKIFHKLSLNSRVIIKSMRVADDTFSGTLSVNGLHYLRFR